MIRRTLSIGPAGSLPRFAPEGHFPNHSRHRGFSLVEVMMSLVLMAIGAALALPSYRDMVEKREVTNGAEQVAAVINTAQGAAMKTNREVSVFYSHSDNDEWCIGASGKDSGCDCTAPATDPDYCEIAVLDDAHAANRDLVHSISGDDSYTFDPTLGLVDAGNPLRVELRSQNEAFRLSLLVNRAGRVMLCSASVQHAVPGYEVCPVRAEAEQVAGS